MRGWGMGHCAWRRVYRNDFFLFVENIWCTKLREKFSLDAKLCQHILVTNTKELSYDEDNDLNLWFEELGQK